MNRARQRPARVALAPMLVCFAWLVGPAPARAYEDQLSLGVSLGYAHLVSDHDPKDGALAALDATLGLDDIWTVRLQLGYGLHPAAQADTDALSLFLASGELLYMVDVLEIVPYFGLGADGLARLHGSTLDADLGAHPVFGLDWLPTRTLVLGLALRPVFLLSALDRDPIYVTISASASLLFDL